MHYYYREWIALCQGSCNRFYFKLHMNYFLCEKAARWKYNFDGIRPFLYCSWRPNGRSCPLNTNSFLSSNTQSNSFSLFSWQFLCGKGKRDGLKPNIIKYWFWKSCTEKWKLVHTFLTLEICWRYALLLNLWQWEISGGFPCASQTLPGSILNVL